jgi:hypothetical protein
VKGEKHPTSLSPQGGKASNCISVALEGRQSISKIRAHGAMKNHRTTDVA